MLRRLTPVCALFALAVAAPPAVAAPAGSLDPTFGSGGVARIAIGGGPADVVVLPPVPNELSMLPSSLRRVKMTLLGSGQTIPATMTLPSGRRPAALRYAMRLMTTRPPTPNDGSSFPSGVRRMTSALFGCPVPIAPAATTFPCGRPQRS